MPKKRKKKLSSESRALRGEIVKYSHEFHHDLDYLKKHIDKLWEHVSTTNERLQDLEIQMNLLSRLVTLLAIEKLGIRLKQFRKLVQRIEKETAADIQIHHLEQLYRLNTHPQQQSQKEK